ncbi:hypothetical protein [uncultured Sphaerochaeta sp.]|uniref:hypothetical protein n=1 Tax=uncultured Sphaerochaeta sp. TaxID=886478 RepID=UPI002A0A2B04|nr:hypothetical protein [uncultured Sphaerochaeta sp.]
MRKFAYALLFTAVYMFLQFLHGNMMEWYYYILLFALTLAIINTKLWDRVNVWAKEKDEEFKNKH